MVFISSGTGNKIGGYLRVLWDLQEEQTAILVLPLLFKRVVIVMFGKAIGSVYSSEEL